MERPLIPPGQGTLALLAVAAAAVLWAVAGVVASSLFSDGVEPVQLVAARAAIAAAGLMLVPGTFRRAGPIRPALELGLAIALVNAAYYLAIDRLPVAVAIVLQYSGPAMLVAYNAVASRRWPAREVTVAVVVAFAGVVLVSEVAGGQLADVDLAGVGFGLASAVLFATYTLKSETAERIFGPPGALARAFGIAAVFWTLVLAFQGWPAPLFESGNVLRVLFVGAGGTLAPFLLYIWAVGHLRSERAVIAATLEPVAAGVIAWAWLGQTLGPLQLTGAVLIVAAVTGLQLARRGVTIAPEG